MGYFLRIVFSKGDRPPFVSPHGGEVSPAGSVGDGRSPLATIAPFEMRCIEYSPPPVPISYPLSLIPFTGGGRGVGTSQVALRATYSPRTAWEFAKLPFRCRETALLAAFIIFPAKTPSGPALPGRRLTAGSVGSRQSATGARSPLNEGGRPPL